MCPITGIGRRDMVGLALLLGCDYCPQGVLGVGKEGAMKLLHLCKESGTRGVASRSHDLLTMFQVWLKGEMVSEDSALEKQIRK